MEKKEHLYHFVGVVLPERAQLTCDFALKFSHLSSGRLGEAKVKIILNKIVASIRVDEEWDIFDLRNVVRNIVLNYTLMIGYIRGYCYNIEITRVFVDDFSVDYVFGIDSGDLSKGREEVNIEEKIDFLKKITSLDSGSYILRCLSDLVSSIERVDDAAFYCYRAIEALSRHCAFMNNIEQRNAVARWGLFRQLSCTDKDDIYRIKERSDPIRHGDMHRGEDMHPHEIRTMSWSIVDRYFDYLEQLISMPSIAQPE
ncbi:hypothetical protein [Xanthobacter flavus]|uniref:hypothetical protein n=1 Tax=Xanthobacter flavus TaxID=281 RepID=UPI003727E12B